MIETDLHPHPPHPGYKLATYQPMTAATPAHDITADRQFIPWLQQEQISLACTTYQTSRLMLLGVNPETGGISGFERIFDRAMGLYATTERFYLSSKYQIWQLDNVLSPGQNYNGYDKLYIPRIGYTTGDLDVHDLAVDGGGRLVFIATMLNCLATLSDRHSCQPLWKPPFISQIINEDRCHLNGLAMVAGEPGYVTAVSRSDIVDGWRDRRESGGVVIDINSNEIVTTGLSMPHSPRWYQDKLWLLNSGRGELGYIDLATGKFEAVAFCPGYLRGLAFWRNYAIAGLSKPRRGDKTLFGLPLDELLATRDADPRCGLVVVDLNTGAIVHWLRFEGVVTELYDVQVIPGVQRPMALGFQTEEIAQLITLEPLASLSKPSELPESESQRQLLVITHHDQGGFFSNFNKVLQLLKQYKDNYDIQVDWTFKGSEKGFRYGDRIGENIWELFFEPLPQNQEVKYSKTIVINRYLDYSFTHVNAHYFYQNPDCQKIRQEYYKIYQQYVTIKPDIVDEVNHFYAEHLAGHLCIGVHKRHWLQQHEQYSRKAVAASDYIAVIKQLVATSGATKIFLATDEEDTVKLMKETFGDFLVCRSDVTRVSASALQEMHWQVKNTGFHLGKEVLIDALILAKCDIFIHGLSNISTAISFINPCLEMVYLYYDKNSIIQSFYGSQNPKIIKAINDLIMLNSTNQDHLVKPLSGLDSQLFSDSDQKGFGKKVNKKSRLKKSQSSPSPHPVQPATNPAQAFLERSRILKQEGNLAEAELCLREAIRLDANNWAAYNNLGTLLQNQGHRESAKTCYQKALQLQPNLAEAISNLASIWQLEEDLEKAKTGFYRALQLKPDYVPAHLNLANIFQEQKRMGAAVEHFQKVVELDPNYTEAYLSFAGFYEYQSKLTEALECYQKVEKLNPDAYYVRTFINYIYLKLCNWQGYEERNQEVIRLVEAHLTHPKSIFSPLNLSAFPVPLSLHQAFAKTFAADIIQKAAATKQRLNFQHRRTTPKKLRLGYISPDFRDHAVGRLIYQIFECHNRDQFEIYAYSTVDVEDHITQKVRAGCDVFVDLSPLSTEAAGRRIYSDGIHILIDLAGYTMGHGAAILALQPAPIQAQFLGYPDTMGAEFIPYAIADAWLITPEIAASYTEAIAYLPHAFVASPLEISPKPMTRAEFGLPEEAFVCCCFNSHYKINPPVFDVWMNILRQVPDAVLWLSGGNETIEQNLRAEAKKRGIEPERIIFATKLPQDEYLARYALADLYLDTLIYNAGSTAAAVLWAGLPLLTCPGETYASRMGASICAAAGFEEMICENVVEYERRAVYLATHPQELAEIRYRLQEKLKSPSDRPTLFQVEAFVRSLESACQMMWQNY